MPGPKLVAPHWWKLGLVLLGHTYQLLQAIEYRLNAGLDGLREDERFQIRWWLETYPRGDGWHEKIKLSNTQSDANTQSRPCDSAHVAGACLGLALRERNVERPLLDDRAGASATLSAAPGKPLLELPVGPVESLNKKLEYAKIAGINTIVLEQGCADCVAEDSKSGLWAQPVETLGEAYDALLRVSTHLQFAKQWCSHRWGEFVEKQGFDASLDPFERDQMLKHALSSEEHWRRVALVCGAGLGKTTNLKWLEAKINRLNAGRAQHLAVFLELRELNGDPEGIIERISKRWLQDRHATGSDEQRKFAVARMLAQGRVTFLLDSLDQANPDPSGRATWRLLFWARSPLKCFAARVVTDDRSRFTLSMRIYKRS